MDVKNGNFTLGADSRPVTPYTKDGENENNESLYQKQFTFQERLNPSGNSTLTISSRNSSGDCLIQFCVKPDGHRPINSCFNGPNYGSSFIIPPKEKDASYKSNYSSHEVTNSLLFTSVQVCIAFVLAGFGVVGAGLILDQVQHWRVFRSITELFILVQSLLGLKGNLEMTMAARLSTQANLGRMKDWPTTFKMAKGNLCLIQCQATVVAFLAALVAILANIWKANSFNFHNAMILCASSLITANIACLILGTSMVVVIVFSHRFKIDPDNIATPIAASLGDVTTLALLASFSQLIQNHTDEKTFPYVCTVIIIFFIALLPLWIYIAYNNEYTSNVVTTGWTPVILAMVISSNGGFILDHAAGRFERLALFQPVVNGVGGNLVAVQASRFSTYLHRISKLGSLPTKVENYFAPWKVFIGKDINKSTARLLLVMSIPAHFIYLLVIWAIKGSDQFEMTLYFLTFYMIFVFIQVMVLLYLAHNLVICLWKNLIDPDNFSIPILTALGDFIGSGALCFSFLFLSLLGDINSGPILTK